MNPATRYVADLRAHRSEQKIGVATIPVFAIGPPDLPADDQATRVKRGLEFVDREFSALLTYLCGELLDLKNSGWLREGEAPLSPEAFRVRLTPRRLTAFEDGSVEVGFNDGGLFWGHEVTLRTDADLKPVDADLEG